MHAKHFQFRNPCFFLTGWNSLIMDKDSWFFTRWVPGCTITICNKITACPLMIMRFLHVYLYSALPPTPTRKPKKRSINAQPISSVNCKQSLQGVTVTFPGFLVIGCDPFKENFQKFWSKTQWFGSVQPQKFQKNWSTLDHFSWLEFGWMDHAHWLLNNSARWFSIRDRLAYCYLVGSKF